MSHAVLLGLSLGEWQRYGLLHADCDLNVVAWWFYRYEPIEDEL